jgi:hypothetical protein
MRYIPLRKIRRRFLSHPEANSSRLRLLRAHRTLLPKSSEERQAYVRKYGSRKWQPLKDWLTEQLGNKCWYTEAELVGAPLVIDHFRPVSKYSWLAFEPGNYRVACPFANSPKHNPLYGCAGGKGDEFPLLFGGGPAVRRRNLKYESPVILDPCNKADCELLVFQADGRPVLNPNYAADPIAKKRVDESNILLNIDHPDFNTKREQLCNAIADDVHLYQGLAFGSAGRQVVISRMKEKLDARAPFSSAARCFLRMHRHHDWVQEILDAT